MVSSWLLDVHSAPVKVVELLAKAQKEIEKNAMF
jgi:hypothetical protein